MSSARLLSKSMSCSTGQFLEMQNITHTKLCKIMFKYEGDGNQLQSSDEVLVAVVVFKVSALKMFSQLVIPS